MSDQDRPFPYGSVERVECVNTRDLKPGDVIWHGQGYAEVRDARQESAIQGHSLMEDQCVVLYRDLENPSAYKNDGYCAFGDVILRVIP